MIMQGHCFSTTLPISSEKATDCLHLNTFIGFFFHLFNAAHIKLLSNIDHGNDFKFISFQQSHWEQFATGVESVYLVLTTFTEFTGFSIVERPDYYLYFDNNLKKKRKRNYAAGIVASGSKWHHLILILGLYLVRLSLIIIWFKLSEFVQRSKKFVDSVCVCIS